MVAFLTPVKFLTELAILFYLTFLKNEVYLPSYYGFSGRSMRITFKWNTCKADPFGVSNGVRQGGVLSPILFTVYLDELLQRLTMLDIGCHIGHHYKGSLCYAEDIALLALSPSALRILLNECELLASEHNLFLFNAAKSQLICFRPSPKVNFLVDSFFLATYLNSQTLSLI